MTVTPRRLFIKNTILGASAALIAPGVFANQEKTAAPLPIQKKLITRPLGRTGITLPVVSMGVMRADNPGLVRAALAQGIVYLDTAHGYQRGKNETMLGETLAEFPRSSYIIATKIPPEDKEGYLAKLELSLQRLRLPYVDILYLHAVADRQTALAPATLEMLKEIKASGKAKHIGISTHKNEPEVIRAAVESGVYEVVLTSCNFKQDHWAEVRKAIAEAATAGLGIVGMKTMAGAFHDKERTRPINCKAALKWVVQDANVTTTIPGVTTFEMLAENCAVNEDLTLTPQEKSDLAVGKAEGGLYCQACESCTPQCPRNLPIPELMRAYMYTYGYGDPAQGQELVKSLNVAENPCQGCSVCTASCVRGFAVGERVSDIARLTAVPEEFLGYQLQG